MSRFTSRWSGVLLVSPEQIAAVMALPRVPHSVAELDAQVREGLPKSALKEGVEHATRGRPTTIEIRLYSADERTASKVTVNCTRRSTIHTFGASACFNSARHRHVHMCVSASNRPREIHEASSHPSR